jgi:hypothetical protein
MTDAALSTPTIFIPKMNQQTAMVNIIGLSPGLICDRLLPEDIQSGQGPKKPRMKKVEDPTPDELFRKALYVVDADLPDDHPDKYGMPAKAFAKAMVRSTTLLPNAKKDLPMTLARMLFTVEGDLIPLQFPKKTPPHLRVDTPRNSNGQVVTKYRAQFDTWTAIIPIVFNADRIVVDMIVNLCAMAGQSVGVGSRRPENGDSFGRWDVESVA